MNGLTVTVIACSSLFELSAPEVVTIRPIPLHQDPFNVAQKAVTLHTANTKKAIPGRSDRIKPLIAAGTILCRQTIGLLQALMLSETRPSLM